LQDHELRHDHASLNRRAQLIAAAEALVVWVHERRATWTSAPLPRGRAAAAAQKSSYAAAPAAYPAPAFTGPPLAAPYEEPPYVPPSPAPVYTAPAPEPIYAAPVPEPAYAPPPVPPYQPPVPTHAAVPQPDPAYAAATYPDARVFTPPPPPPVIKVEPPRPIKVETYVPPRSEVAPPASVERFEPRPREESSSGVATSAGKWGVRLGVAAAILAALLVGATQLRPYLTKLNAPKMGTAVIESTPTGSDVSIDGKPAGKTPFSTDLAAGPHVLEFRRRSLTRTLEIDVAAGESTTSKLDWNAKPIGKLIVESEPTGARVVVDGKMRGSTPLTLADLSVGSHTVTIESDKGSVRRTVSVTSGRETTISETIFSGFLKVFAPFEVTVSEGTRGLRLDDHSQVMLAPGPHELRFESKEFGYHDTRKVDIEPGKTASLTLTPDGSKLSVTATVPAEVLVDGQHVGDTPLNDQPIALGTRDIVVKSPAGERHFSQTVTTKPVRLEVDFSKP
jgi:hypothetical protein